MTPDIDDAPFDCTFMQKDIEQLLSRITFTMKKIRSQPGWVAADLIVLKDARRKLHPYLHYARRDQITRGQEIELNALIKAVCSLGLASQDDAAYA